MISRDQLTRLENLRKNIDWYVAFNSDKFDEKSRGRQHIEKALNHLKLALKFLEEERPPRNRRRPGKHPAVKVGDLKPVTTSDGRAYEN